MVAFVGSMRWPAMMSVVLRAATQAVTPPPPCGSVSFLPGRSAYLRVDAAPTIRGDFTIEFWAKRTNSNARPPWLFSIYSNFTASSSDPAPQVLELGISVTPQVVLWMNGSAYATSTFVNSTQWRHFAVVRSDSQITLYIQGVSSARSSYPRDIYMDAFYIGRNNAGLDPAWLGYIANFRVVNSALYTCVASSCFVNLLDSTPFPTRDIGYLGRLHRPPSR